MDERHKPPPDSSEIKSGLPDVVHSQQIPAVGNDLNDPENTANIGENLEEATISQDVEDTNTESISEHIPSKIEYSSDSENEANTPGLLRVEMENEKLSKTISINIPNPESAASDNLSTHNPSKGSSSCPLDVNAVSDIHLLSIESPVNLALSELSKETEDNSKLADPEDSQQDSPIQTPLVNDILDSLNHESILKSSLSGDISVSSGKTDTPDKVSSSSEEIIKLDIRGKGVPKFQFPAAKIIFGPPPEDGIVLQDNVEPIPVFPNLLSPFLVGAGDIKVEEVFDDPEMLTVLTPEKTPQMSPDKQSLSSDKVEADLLVEEITVEDELKEIEDDRQEEMSIPKSIPPEETMSFSTLTTDYKTICEEYHVKLVHLEDAISQRDELIEELTISLQRSVHERDELRNENDHLINEVQNLQHLVAERSSSEHDTIKGQLSDFMKYQSLVKDDTTKFYSALMSGGSSMHSSNGEKDMDREEIVINHSRSDLKSSEASGEFQTGFETKVASIIDKFDEFIEENLRNKLRESLIQVLCDEIGKMRLEADTEVKELETQMQQDKHAFTVETRKLRELLSSVKAGNADIDALRQELDEKHEKEMVNLRTYFEKKCSDLERSYSEEVSRGKAWSPTGSASSLDAAAAGDCLPRRSRSAEFPALSLDAAHGDLALKQACRKYEHVMDELKCEHLSYVNELQARQKEAVATLEEQITQLKAHIQTNENTEGNVSLYQQDIDLELEKKMEAQLEARLEEVREEVRQEVVNHFQEQLQVLLSDPDAEVSSWPLELVALRDKIHGDARAQRECSSLRDELSIGEDKWKQRRNLSFDQNRQLEEVTKERDELRRVALSLHGVVGQLVAYCACAEDELNRTVLAHLLPRLIHAADESGSFLCEEQSRPGTPTVGELDSSVVSRGGKHVHFAPDLHAILADLDEEGVVGLLEQQRDVSAEIKRELEISLRRLRNEAHSLLELSGKLTAKNCSESKMLESSEVQITELVDELDTRQKPCEDCELHRKNMEEAMAECLQRENLLRADLEGAMLKIADLMATDVIAEGYGTGEGEVEGEGRRGLSLDGAASPCSPRSRRLASDLDGLTRERDDLHQQLEAANRQLRSTRQFVEEQAGEREAERDEFARRLADLRDDNARLAARLQTNARMLNEMHCLRLSYCNCREHDAHVEQLEAQAREMNQLIMELEARKATTDDELKASDEKISLLRDIIANLESQLEQKTNHEAEILQELEQMRKTIEERDGKIRVVLGELESLRNERAEQSDVVCMRCGQEEDKNAEFLDKVKEECRYLEAAMHRRTRQLERTHEQCSASCSEPSEDVSLRDRKLRHQVSSPEPEPAASDVSGRICELAGLWECLQAQLRAEDAVLKRVADLEMQRAQLKEVAQEVRAERDVLQARMSEQALKISSLSARLSQQRHDADALSLRATADLSVQLHDARAEVQRLHEELDSRDKQLARLKHTLDERDAARDDHNSLYGNSCKPKDKVIILERELSVAQSRIAQLETLVRGLEQDKDELQATLRDCRRTLAEKQEQLHELMALKLDEDIREERSDVIEGKASARTLSDIVSISEFDEQDLQMRRAELKNQNVNISDAPFADVREKTLNTTLPPDLDKPNMTSLNIEHCGHFELGYTPRADSLPAHLTSTQNKDIFKEFKRNVNETTMFGTENIKHSTAQNIPDNCSMYPNRDVSESKNVTVEPKKINFSLDADNKTSEEFTSLRELGITLDIKQENFPDILTQLKHEIKKSRTELENCKSELKNAEEQLCEFPALKEEVEELKGLLENTMATMETDKKFYENQLENFSSNKKLFEQRLSELTQEVNDKAKDLHLLKEDILRRENMILELAKEKRNLTNKMTELEVKIDELQSRNNALEKYENESRQMREQVTELQKLEQLVSEKNQQIDSLNQHLDRLDDLQRCLNDKSEELDNLKEAYNEKSNEVFQTQDAIEALKLDIVKINDEHDKLITENKDLKLKLTKLEKEQENASLKLQNSESELERVNSLNNELTIKIEELKILTDKLKDKETEIEILHEDINAFHEEIASLKEQLKMVSRSPSPRNKSGDERKSLDRQATNDKKQLAKIRKQISLLQHELDFNKKDLNDKAFELAKAKLDVTELKNNLSQIAKQATDKETDNAELRSQCEELQRQIQLLSTEKQQLSEQLQHVVARIREESNTSELKNKLQQKAERCKQLEAELENLREMVDRRRASPPGSGSGSGGSQRLAVRSPTAELEMAVRDQLHYSHTLDEDIMEQILSGSSDEREDIPRLALNSSKSSSSIHSTSSDRLNRLRSDNEKLQMQVANLESRIKDKDALITELNRVRDKLVQDWQSSKLRYEAERDNSGRLQLLLDTHKETAETLQNQDSNMIQILKKRLESAMRSELELQQREQQLKARLALLERQALAGAHDAAKAQLQHELDAKQRLQGELRLLRGQAEAEQARQAELQASLERSLGLARRELDDANQRCTALKTELAEIKRLKHETGVQLLRAQELARTHEEAANRLRSQLSEQHVTPVARALTEIESTKSELSRELASLRQCVASASASAPEVASLRADKQRLAARVRQLEEEQQRAQEGSPGRPADEREHAIRYLHGRCLRLESCRKALVWQKRYLQRVLAGYTELERNLRLPSSKAVEVSTGKKRFKCAALAVAAAVRMRFLVRRRLAVRAMAAAALLAQRGPQGTVWSPLDRGRAASSAPAAPSTPSGPSAPSAPRTVYRAPPDSLARRVLKQDLRLNLPTSPGIAIGDFARKSPYAPSSPQDDPFILTSPRGEVAAAYLSKLELVSRCLSHAMEASRDVP